MIEKSIPIVVGVSGHRDLRDEEIPKLREAVGQELQKIKTEYPESPLWMLNSLAAGADQLCAEVAVNMGIPLYAALPMEEEEYKKDFSENELAKFEELRANAVGCFVASKTEAFDASRDYLYRQAGIYVAKHSHVLLALWDGQNGAGLGCGTAEAVDFMLSGNFNDGKAFHAANDGAVIHIVANRKKNKETYPFEVKLIENEEGSLKSVLSLTNRFNKEALACDYKSDYELLPGELVKSEVGKRIQKIYDIADKLAVDWQKSYLKMMRLIASFSVILVILYLLYDEAEFNFCLIIYGITILVFYLTYRGIGKRMHHDRYLQYRALAESLRVQMYFHALGIDECVGDDFTWTQKHDSTWVKEALAAILIGENNVEPVPMEVVKEKWIIGQKNYHLKAGGRDKKTHDKKEKATILMIVATLVTWAIVFVLEYFFKDVMIAFFFGYMLRTWFKILWGCLAAVTVFVSSYFGKMSLERKSYDHEKMQLLFESALSHYEREGCNRIELMRQLGREEIIENGNWVSYCRENTPDLSV